VQTTWARDHDAPLWIATAMLELAPQPLHQQILTAIAQARSQGAQHLILLPLFLLPGVHVREDIPHEVALAQAMGDQLLPLTIAPYVGSHLGMTALLRRQFAFYPNRGRILLAHGSRRIGGNQPVEAMAQRLTATPAYWSVQPSLARQLQRLVTDEQTDWIIQPYFLFPGGITDAIAQQLGELRTQWPLATLDLGTSLSDTPEFIPLILDWMQQPHFTPSSSNPL
jgi:sirohydrochlorin ferrochelatase